MTAPGRSAVRARFVQPLVVAAIVIAGLYFGRPVLEPLALAVLFSLMLVPVVRWLGAPGRPGRGGSAERAGRVRC